MTADTPGPVISVMLAVPDAAAAARWYARAFGATELWNLGSVVGFATTRRRGASTVRVASSTRSAICGWSVTGHR